MRSVVVALGVAPSIAVSAGARRLSAGFGHDGMARRTGRNIRNFHLAVVANHPTTEKDVSCFA